MIVGSTSSGDDGDAAWFVDVAGQVTPMTLDQLDAAFKAGLVREETRVWTQGMTDWVSLAELTSSEREPIASHNAAQVEAEHEMSDNQMSRVDPRLWALADQDDTARERFSEPDMEASEMEVRVDDLEPDDDVTPCGEPLAAALARSRARTQPPRAVLNAAVAAPLPIVTAPLPIAVALLPIVTAPTPAVVVSSVPASDVPPPNTLPPPSMSSRPLPPRTLPPSRVASRAATLPQIPPPRSMSAAPVPAAVTEADVMSALTYSTFPSMAPMTLSEPVIPLLQPEPPWNYRLWAASAAAALGLSLYGWSVFQLADSSSGDASKASSVLARSGSSTIQPEPTSSDPAIRPATLARGDTSIGTTTTAAASPELVEPEPTAEPAEAQVVSADVSNADVSKAVVKPTKKKKKRTVTASSSRKAKKASTRVSAQKRTKAKKPGKSARPAWLAKFAGSK